jgi:hypothetical protein
MGRMVIEVPEELTELGKAMAEQLAEVQRKEVREDWGMGIPSVGWGRPHETTSTGSCPLGRSLLCLPHTAKNSRLKGTRRRRTSRRTWIGGCAFPARMNIRVVQPWRPGCSQWPHLPNTYWSQSAMVRNSRIIAPDSTAIQGPFWRSLLPQRIGARLFFGRHGAVGRKGLELSV